MGNVPDHMTLFARLLLPAVLLLAIPAAASAVEPAGRGENVTPVRNIPYPDVRAPSDGVSHGTDVEFATMTFTQTVMAKKRPSKKDTTTSFERTFAFAGSYGDGLQIIDVTDPEDAKLVSTWDCGVSQGDVQVFQRDDLGGRWFATYTHDTGYTFRGGACEDDLVAMGKKQPSDPDFGTYIADVTDPYNPKTVSFLPVAQGSHNLTVHPSGKYVYNSNSDLITSFRPAIEIASIEDIENPVSKGEFPLLTLPGLGTESHDITFNADGSRAYVAALSHGEVLDTTNPVAPSRAGVVVDPAINVWHQSDPVTLEDPILGKRDFIIIEDEVAGAEGTGQCPNGGVHVYDATGDLEQAPVKVGYWNIDDAGTTENGIGTCTAHVFDIHPNEKLMTIAYYNGGVRVVDLSGLVGVALGKSGVGMKQLGYYRFPDSDMWSVKAPTMDRSGFYMYANDHARGFDVYRYAPGTTSSSSSTGTWLTAAEQRRAQQRAAADGGTLELQAICLLGEDRRAETARAADSLGWTLAR
jgi:hypothetical protein